MQYAVIKDSIVISTCDHEPCSDDLATRGEISAPCEETEVIIGYTYDGSTFSPPIPIVTPFPKLREGRWAYIKSQRDLEERLPLPYMGKLLDFDTLSSERLTWAISAATTAKLLSQSFTIDWTTLDGSVLVMSEFDILGIPTAVASRSNIIHQKAREKAQEIAVAATVEELEGIVWEFATY